MSILDSTRRWLHRKRGTLAVAAGIVGVGYLTAQYVVSRVRDARERESDDRIARENLRRRFQQNQEDCSLTVLALLPTATSGIFDALNTDKIAHEIQLLSAGRGSLAASGADSTATGIIADEDGRSLGSSKDQSESGLLADSSASASASADSSENAGANANAPTVQSTAVDETAPAEASGPKPSKRQLWDDLKVASITRAFTLIYTIVLLNLLTRIQLNLLGRRSYLSSVVWLATGCPPGGGGSPISLENNDEIDESFLTGDRLSHPHQRGRQDFDGNRRYLAFSWWLLHCGWPAIQTRVEAAVRATFSELSPRDALSLKTFSTLTARVRDLVENPASSHDSPWLSILLPPVEREAWVLSQSGILDVDSPESSDAPIPLRHLLDETADLVESAAFTHVLKLLLHATFSLLIDQKLATAAFKLPLASGDLSSSQSANRAVLLPRILSVLSRQAHAIGNPDPNEYLAEMDRVHDLEAFAAVVYSSNWENELRPLSTTLILSSTALAQAHAPVPAPASAPSSASSPVSTTIASTTAAVSESVVVVLPVSTWTQDPSTTGYSDRSESGVMVDTQASFESAWGNALDKKNL